MSQRSSNIELFRILVMLAIIAHHYVVNSGVIGIAVNDSTARATFTLIFGAWGKIGIDCFVLITGWFMCTSHITLRKFLKIFLTLEFYNVIFYGIFLCGGYESLSLRRIVKVIFPFNDISYDFSVCFLLFYLLIPFLNKLLRALPEKEHLYLVLLTLGMYSFIGSIPFMYVVFNYVTWFTVLYISAAYLRLHAYEFMARLPRKMQLIMQGKYIPAFFGISLVIASTSICLVHFIRPNISYFFVADSNKLLAVVISVLAFLSFKRLNIPPSKLINTVASTTFGVLCIHANSDAMRKWLWQDVCRNAYMYQSSSYFIYHAICVVLAVFIVCSCLELLRKRYLEKPLLDMTESLYQKIGRSFLF